MTKPQASRCDHSADLVADDRAEANTDRSPQSDTREPADHEQHDLAAVER